MQEDLDYKELVFVDQNNRPATDSIRIAEAFEKRHDKVLRDIRSLRCSDEFRLSNFGESSYENQQGRKMPLFIVSYDGFAFLCMGYNGEKADRFKERYINEFNRTRTYLETQQNFLESSNVGKLLEIYEDRVTLNSDQQNKLNQSVKERIHHLYPSISNKARAKYFSALYRDLRHNFGVRSYRDISDKHYHDAIQIVNEWALSNFGETRGER
ncbi:Rha family transcriptional regulator [Salibacterium halotolerans]|uniref:Phage regulatory protein, rha family n=1 Tax=Salibacterium halotolerans TaxID=1884432 RepID=A0A1I5MK61_9BACI|nr:Rha family transcriptional regulator [Salibacterium halotolerans]SFP09697.1 phage regulatory protein, rha family [Salibacterium halotolerans]